MLGADQRNAAVGPYYSANFNPNPLSYSFGQAPSWTTDGTGNVLSTQLDTEGISQIYSSHLDGTSASCLTCATVQGPNGLPQEGPAEPGRELDTLQSYGEQPAHLANPGLAATAMTCT